MKKFITLLVTGLIFIMTLQAQTSGTTYTLPQGITTYSAFSLTHTGDWAAASLKDSIGGTAEKYWTFNINRSALYYYQFFVEYDTVLTVARAVGNHVTVWLQSSIDGTNYVNIDSVLFHPTTMWLPAAQAASATSAALGEYALKDVSTGVLWKYLRIKAIGGDAATCSLISKLAVKIGIRY